MNTRVNRRPFWGLGCASLLGMVYGGCGVGGADLAIEGEAASLVEGEAPTCDGSEIVWADPGAGSNVCAGPWEYERNGTCVRQHESCGPKNVCDEYKSCEDWSLKSPYTFTKTYNYTVGLVTMPPVCTTIPGGGGKTCTKPTIVADYQEANARCDEHRQADLANERSKVPSQFHSNVTATYTVSSNNTTGYTTCTVTINSYQAPTTQRAACGCAVELHHPSCEVTDAACNTSTGVKILSSPGIARSALPADDAYHQAAVHVVPPRCTTCDELPMGTPQEVRAKFACLKATWDQIPASTPEPAPESTPAEKPAKKPGRGTAKAGDTTKLTDITLATGTTNATGTTQKLTGNTANVTDWVFVDRDRFEPGTGTPVTYEPYVVPAGPGKGALDEDTRAALGKRMMLLFELRGESLDAEAREFVQGLYAAFPNLVTDCGFATSELPAPSCDQEDSAAIMEAIACERVLAQGSNALSLISVPRCARALEQLSRPLPEGHSCDVSSYAESMQTTLRELTEKGLRVLEDVNDPFASLPHALFALRRYYEATRFALESTEVDALDDTQTSASTRARTHALAMLERFWRHAQAGRRVFAGLAAAEDVKAAVENAASTGMQLDQDVLEAAFSSTGKLPAIIDRTGYEVVSEQTLADFGDLPLRGPMLAALVDGALGGLNQRIESMIETHDFACLLLACTKENHTPISQLWGLLGALSDEARLAEMLATTNGTLNGWTQVFAAIRAKHSALLSAIAVDEEGALDPLAEPLSARIASARQRYAAYAASGQLVPGMKRSLHAGLNAQQREVVMTHLNAQLMLLDHAVNQYENTMMGLLSGLIAGQEIESAGDRLAAEFERLSLQYQNAEQDLAGLRQNDNEQREDMSDIVAAYESIADSIDTGAFLQVMDVPTVSTDIGADIATFNGFYRGDVRTFTSRPVIQVEKGRVLRVLVDGYWAPTCSLAASGDVLDPHDFTRREPIVFAGVFTGPEGYSLHYSEGRYRAFNHTDTGGYTRTFSAGTRREVCMGSETPSPDIVDLSFSWKACAYAGLDVSFRNGHSDDRSQGTDRRSTASFAAGLRLSNTPFVDLPVGALLAVVMPRGEVDPRKATDIYVMRRGDNTVIASEDSDIYLVANDLGTCAQRDLSQKLDVTYMQMMPFGEVAEVTVDTMADLVEEVRNVRERFLRQASISGAEMAALRSWANFALEARLDGIAVSALPSPLHTLFQAFLDHELVGIERAVAIRQQERALRILELQLLSIADEIKHNDRKGQLSTLMSSWHLRHLDADAVRGQVGYTMEQARSYLYPILELWYPNVLAEIRTGSGAGYVRSKLLALRDAPLDAWTLDLVSTAKDALQGVLSVYATTQPGDPATTYKPIVALSFMNTEPFDEFANAEPAEGFDANGEPAIFSELPKAEDDLGFLQVTRSQQVWDAIRNGTTLDITIRPDDIYGGATGGYLSCSYATPVIERMAVVVIRKDKGANAEEQLAKFNQYRRLSGTAASRQPFAAPEGLVTYTLEDNPDTVADENVWRSFDIPLIYTSFETPIDSFRELVLNNDSRPDGARGLSPFGTITIDFSPFKEFERTAAGNGLWQKNSQGELVYDAVEVALMMQVSGRQVLGNLSWIDSCVPSGSDPFGDNPFDPGEDDDAPVDDDWFWF